MFTSEDGQEIHPVPRTSHTIISDSAGSPDVKAGPAPSQGYALQRRIEIGVARSSGTESSTARGGGESVFPTNYVSTTKYELWNIVPKNLWEQFHRVANIWFLIVSIFQMLPLDLSPTSPFATFIPLCCVLFVTFCKDSYEDYGRRRDDRRVNMQTCLVIDGLPGVPQPHSVKWKDVHVGEFLLLQRDEAVPADMVQLSCSNEDGVAYVDTAQLDGETSLKPKFALEETMRIKDTKVLLSLFGHLMTEPPNQLIQSFSGLLFLQGFVNPRGCPIDAKNFLLRGSTLRNTAWVYGLVVFTGYDTKLVQNLRKTPSKRSRVEVTANVLLLIVFGVLFFAAAVSAAARALYVDGTTAGFARMHWAWPERDPLRDNNFLALITFMIGYNNLIPISLYVTTDLARTFQGVRMELDSSMYHAETDSTCRVRNCGLNEDLGQIEFVLTDKTGTLTENKMEFKACSIDGMIYGRWDEDEGPIESGGTMPPSHICWPLSAALPPEARRGSKTLTVPVNPPPVVYGNQWDEEKGLMPLSGQGHQHGHRLGSRKRHLPSIPSKDASEEEIEACSINQFWMCLATCHTAIVEHLPAVTNVPSKSSLKPESSVRVESSATAPASLQTVQFTDISGSSAGGQVARGTSSQISSSSAGEATGAGGPVPLNRQPQPPGEIPIDPEWEELLREAAGVALRSSSPDDEALVMAARGHGFFVRKKAASKLTINVRGKDRYYQVLIFNDFTSERKRMSVLVQQIDSPQDNVAGRYDAAVGACVGPQFEPNGSKTMEFGSPSMADLPDMPNEVEYWQEMKYKAVLYAKGADNVMLERLADPHCASVAHAKKHMKDFASHGLRTLLLAKRELTPEQVQDFMRRMFEAKGAFMNRDAMIEAVANDMETEMELLGVTAVEDRIQQGVPETVHMLLRAGIKVWMLTGDNMETAINIGLACKLVDMDMRQFKLDAQNNDASASNVLKKLDEFYTEVHREVAKERRPGDFKYCLILHGKVLYTIMETEQVRLRQLFLALACSSCSVIACRLAPAQKAALVLMVRNNVIGNPLTLAIGDGGNDVSMIQEAHVGVGILGVEGRQAANAADFTIGQFRFLQQMLFVHGRWNLRRTCIVIGYSFYKNFLLVLPLAFYAPWNGFSGTTLYESYLLTTFNLAFTSLPILILGIFDIDVSAKMALLVPSLYQLGIQRCYFNSWTLIGWIARGTLHSLMLFLTMKMVIDGWPAGQIVPDQLVMGSWAYGACVAVANIILLLHTKAWMDWGVIVLVISVLLFLPALLLYSDGAFFLASTFEPQMVGVATCLFGNIRSWLGLILVTTACALSDLALLFCRRLSAPDAADLLQEVQLGHFSGVDKLPGEAWAQLAARKACAEDCLKHLPSPPPQVHQLKPEGKIGYKPLRDSAKKFGKSGRHNNDWFNGKSSSSVVPASPTSGGEEVMFSQECIITYPETYWERWSLVLHEFIFGIWNWQWREMTVTELAFGFGYNRIEVSKHFKSAVRSSLSERPGAQDGLPGAARRASLATVVDPATAVSGGDLPSQIPDPDVGFFEFNRKVSCSSAASRRSIKDEPPTENPEGETEVVEDLIYSMVTLRFLNPEQELGFKNFLIKQAAQLFQICLGTFVFACIMWLLYEMTLRREEIWRDVLVTLGCCFLSGLAVCLLRSRAFQMRAEFCIVFVVFVGIFFKHAYDVSEKHSGLLFNAYFPVFIIAGLRVRFTNVVLILIYHLVALLLRYWLLAVAVPVQAQQKVLLTSVGQLPAEYFVLMLGIICLSVHYAYMLEKIMRKDFYVMESIFRSKNQALEILTGMFPQEVVDHVLMKVRKEDPCMRKLQSDCGIVTILFCDIHDFDGITQSLRPMELVQLLDLVWMLFDRICERHGTVKIETVGKTYMACAMPENGAAASSDTVAQGASKAVLTGISMLGLVSQRFTGIGKLTHVDVRIGVHTGRALSGVVGSTKPQFALFGDTVNTASRMQSTGKRGCLHASSATHAFLRDDRRFEWKGRKIEAKGKGIMDTFLLTRYNSEIDEAQGKAPARAPRTLSTTTSETMVSCVNVTSSTSMGTREPRSTSSNLSATAVVPRGSFKGSRKPSYNPLDELVTIPSISANAAAAAALVSSVGSRSASVPEHSEAMPPILRVHTAPASLPVNTSDSFVLSSSEKTDKDHPSRKNERATSSQPSSSTPRELNEDLDSCDGKDLIEDPTPQLTTNAANDGLGQARRMSLTSEANLEMRGMKLIMFTQSAAQITQAPRPGRRSSVTMVAEATSSWARSWWGRLPYFWRRLCHSCANRDEGIRIRSAPLFSLWGSFVAFWVCYSAEALCVVTSHYAKLREVGEGGMQSSVWTRCGFMVVGCMASVVLYYVGKRQLWGEGASSFVSKAFADIIAIVVFIGFVCTFIANVLTTHLSGTEEQRMFWMVFESFFFFMVLVHLCSLSPHSVVPLFLCLVVIICTLGYVGIERSVTSESDLLLECAGSSVFLLMMHLIAKMWDPRRANVEHKSICEEHERVSELLDSMLPREVLAEMKSGHLSLAYNYKDMTLLFADIVGFTRYCAEHTAEQAVNLVTKLFAEFDEQVLKLGVYKVCTIGDAYVAVNEPRTEVLDKYSECARVLEMAIYMLRTINRVRDEVNHTGLDMRIGLHIGRFAGGVIGTKRLRFDIWGEDVLIGNNVESHGKPGEIAVSGSAKEVLEECVSDLQYTFNEEIKLKTGRVVRTYICRPNNGESFAERLLQ